MKPRSWSAQHTEYELQLETEPVVVAYGQLDDVSEQNLRILVFLPVTLSTVSANATGELMSRSWDGATWQWSDTGKAIVGQPAVLLRGGTARPYPSGIRINLFAQGADGELWEYYFDGGQWSWTDTDRQVAGDPRVIAWGDRADLSAANLRIQVYCRDPSGELWIRYWNGATWAWSNADRVVPPDGNAVPLLVGHTRSHNLQDVRLHLFAVSVGGHLWERYWDGSTWYGYRDDSTWNPSMAVVSYLQKFRDPEFDGGLTAGMTYSHEQFTVSVDEIYSAETDPLGSTSEITITY